MPKSIVVFLLLVLVSCQKKETGTVVKHIKEDNLQTSDLYSKVYYISPKLNTENCTAYNDGCDCCDGKIVFLKNGTFISDFYCIPTESYNTGTFKIKNNKLVLNYSKKEALFGPEDDEDYEGENILRLDSIDYGMVRMDVIKCKNKFVFKGVSDYFSEDKKTPYSIAVNQYKKKGVWKLLDIKE